ncbi:MAG: energy transducer TonB [Prevotella sp.]|nr:energy transducer TonB [Prevotella sp.]
MKQKTFSALLLALIMASMQATPMLAQTTTENRHDETDTIVSYEKTRNRVEIRRDDNDGTIWCDIPETQPSFLGGTKALMEWVKENMKYPDELADSCVQGRVVVSFIINEDGTVSDGKVVKSVHPLLDAEALRLVSIMPRWIPYKLLGKARKTRYFMPVKFETE